MTRLLAIIALLISASVCVAQGTAPPISLPGSAGVTGSSSLLGANPVAMSSDANVTLTPNQWWSFSQNVTSSVSLTATRNIVVPLNAGQFYAVENSTTGGQSIQIIGATGTGVTVPNGYRMAVYCDGTNYYSLSGLLGPATAGVSGNIVAFGANGVAADSGRAPTVLTGTGHVPVENSGDTAFVSVPFSGDISLSSTGATSLIATTNSTLTTLSALTLPGSQVTGTVPAATTAGNLTGTPALPNGVTATTQTAGDTTTKLATDAFATAAATAVAPASVTGIRYGNGAATADTAASQSNITSTYVPPVAGAISEWSFDGNQSTAYPDLIGSNTATLCTGGTAPTNEPGIGVGFSDTGVLNTANCINVPTLLDFGTIEIAMCSPQLAQNTGTNYGNQYNSFPTFFGSTQTSTGVDLLNYAFNYSNPVIQGTLLTMNVFSAASGTTTTAAAQGTAGCNDFIYSFGTSGTSVDHQYTNGVENTYLAQGANRANVTVTTGGYQFGMGKNTATFGSRMLLTYARALSAGSTTFTAANAFQDHQYIQQKLIQRPALLSRLLPPASTSRLLQLLCLGDSLTAGFGGVAPCPSLISTTNTYNITNLGIGGFLAGEIAPYYESRVRGYVVPGNTTVVYWAGTNDFGGEAGAASRTFNDVALSDMLIIGKVHADRGRIVCMTMISRTGTNNLYTTNEGAKLLRNAQLRSSWKTEGCDALADVAEVALLGGPGANTDSCFNPDHIHINGTNCGINVNTTGSISGDTAVGVIISNTINSLDGSSAANPDISNSNAVTLTPANNNIVIYPTAAATVTLADAQGRAIPHVITNGTSSANNITASSLLSQIIVGSTTIAPLATAVFQPVPSLASFTATGSGTNLTVSTVNGFIVPGTMLATVTGVPANTTIVSQTSGTTGGAGVYVTSASTTISAGTETSGGGAYWVRTQ